MSEIGTAVYNTNEFKKRTNATNANWGLKEGSNIYRVLPPFGTMAASGFWSKFEVIHWGYSLSTGKQRPFRCIKQMNHKTKQILVSCPQCEKNDEQAKLMENARKEYIDQGVPKEIIKKNLESFTDWGRRFNTERRHFLNVMRLDGQIGRLKISNDAMRDLRAEIKRLRDTKRHSDPCGINGLYFDFYRTGMGRDDTTFKISALTDVVSVPGPGGQQIQAEVLKAAPLTPGDLERFKTEGFDLGDYYKELSRDEIQLLVESGGDPETVDGIFGLPKLGTTTSNAGFNPAEEFQMEEESPEVAPVAVTAPTPDVALDEESALMAQLAALQAKKKAPKAISASTEVSLEDYMAAVKANKSI